ncbi:MAG: class B sortase [Bacilli bacterium]|nr:class B sortase [Bacilli bacterium]
MKRVLSKRKIIAWIIILICLIGLIISIVNIVIWYKDNKKTADQIEWLSTIAEIDEVETPEEIQEEPVEEEGYQLPSFYYDYMKMNLINVNFNELKAINSDTAGWIQVNGTNVNYPFVKTTDNSYYLTHSFDKSGNYAGWIFMDYRNNIKTFDKNTILYGHGRLDRTMFGSIRDILTNGWLNNPNNFVIKLSTESENTLWQVFSVYRIPTTNDYLRVSFSSNDDFKNFTNMLINRSQYNFNTTVSPDDYILTLSTCHGQTDKVVIHAKLIKKETR